MKKKNILLLLMLITFILSSCALNIKAPEKVTIDNVEYRTGFYGDLYPQMSTNSLIFSTTKSATFWKINHEYFDLLNSIMKDDAAGVNTVYCRKDQFERAEKYYEDPDNFIYCCMVGNRFDNPEILTFSDTCSERFEELSDFAEANEYDPFNSTKNKRIERVHRPIPDESVSPELVFYKGSKDGCFTSYQGSVFLIVDAKMYLLFYYDYGHGEYEEMQAVEVPDDLGLYFMDLLSVK